MKTTALLLSALIAPALAQLSGSSPVFSEIHPNPSATDGLQFIELYNPSGASMNLGGYKVCDSTMTTCTDLKGSVMMDSYYVICRDISEYMHCNIGTKLFLGTSAVTSLVLVNPSGIAIDQASWASANIPANSSYVRGLIAGSPLAFGVQAGASAGVGYLGGPGVTSPPTQTPTTKATTLEPTPSPTNPPTPGPTNSPTLLRSSAPSAGMGCRANPCHSRATCAERGGAVVCTW